MNVTKTVTVERVSMWSIGVKNWYVFQDDTGARYQRWSFVMDDVDEILMLLKAGDIVHVTYDDGLHGNDTPKRTIVAMEMI